MCAGAYLLRLRPLWYRLSFLVLRSLLISAGFAGIFVYSYQGQFTLGLAYQGVSKYAWQTVGNVISSVTCIISVRIASHLVSRPKLIGVR
jgi:hypothetical protein